MTPIVGFEAFLAPDAGSSIILHLQDTSPVELFLDSAALAAALTMLQLGNCYYRDDSNIVHQSF